MIIKKLMILDKRIIYIRNKENKGQFQSRNEGVLLSKGKYILILDPDDFLLNDILIKSFKAARKFKLDNSILSYNGKFFFKLFIYSK